MQNPVVRADFSELASRRIEELIKAKGRGYSGWENLGDVMFWLASIVRDKPLEGIFTRDNFGGLEDQACIDPSGDPTYRDRFAGSFSGPAPPQSSSSEAGTNSVEGN